MKRADSTPPQLRVSQRMLRIGGSPIACEMLNWEVPLTVEAALLETVMAFVRAGNR